MFKVSNVSKYFGGRCVLADVSFVVNPGEVAGLIGPNGAGKTTLLNIIAAVEAPDHGSVATTAARIGYLRQGHARDAGLPAREVFPAAFAARHAPSRVRELASALAATSDPARREALEREYEVALAAAAGPEDVVDCAWRALDLRPVAQSERVGLLSGGELTKLGLIDLAAKRPDGLLLDEPTNNLDLPALAWLDEYLDTFEGPVLLVSHDRALLDGHATQILGLDARAGRLEEFAGDYTAYAAEKARREAELWARYRRQQEREEQLTREIRAIGATAQRREHMSQNDYLRRRNKKFARRGVVMQRRLEREIASAEHVDKPITRQYRVKAELPRAARGGDRMLFAEGVTLAVERRELLRNADLNIGWGERVVLIGANGSGKTTLLRALMGEQPLAAGRIGRSPSATVGYLPQNERDEPASSAKRTPVEVIRGAAAISETDARRFLHRFLFGGDGALTPVDRLSYGERRRLSLARLVLGGANILLLDEPTNHLDIPSREAFEQALDSYEGAILAVTHDRYFIERFAQRILSLEDGALREVYV